MNNISVTAVLTSNIITGEGEITSLSKTDSFPPKEKLLINAFHLDEAGNPTGLVAASESFFQKSGMKKQRFLPLK